MERLTRHAEQPGGFRPGPIQRRQNFFAQKFAGLHERQAALREQRHFFALREGARSAVVDGDIARDRKMARHGR